MNSFAFWCRPKEGGEESNSSAHEVEAMVNINLWIAGGQGEGRKGPTAFDFGLMLSLGTADAHGEANLKSGAVEEENASVLNLIKGISLYCPFKIKGDHFFDLMPRLNKETLGAIFNDRCRVSEVDFSSRYVVVNLANDEDKGEFLLMSCEDFRLEECDAGAATVINIDFPRVAKEVSESARRVYVRFRLSIDHDSALIRRSDSRDKLFTSAFSREEAIDLRINDYRTLTDEIREKVDGVDPDAYRLSAVTVHTLLMARTGVAVESFEDLHEKRLLEGGNVWGGYLPEGLTASDVVAWHWKKRLKAPGDGYKMYLKLSCSVCNWTTIGLYLLFLTAFSIFTNAFTSVLCDSNHHGSPAVAAISFAICVLLFLGFVVFKARRPQK